MNTKGKNEFGILLDRDGTPRTSEVNNPNNSYRISIVETGDLDHENREVVITIMKWRSGIESSVSIPGTTDLQKNIQLVKTHIQSSTLQGWEDGEAKMV